MSVEEIIDSNLENTRQELARYTDGKSHYYTNEDGDLVIIGHTHTEVCKIISAMVKVAQGLDPLRMEAPMEGVVVITNKHPIFKYLIEYMDDISNVFPNYIVEGE